MEKEFESEEELLKFLKQKLGYKEGARIKNKDRRKPDLRAGKDPYYDTLKNDADNINIISDSSSPSILV